VYIEQTYSLLKKDIIDKVIVNKMSLSQMQVKFVVFFH